MKLNQPILIKGTKWFATPLQREGLDVYALVEVMGQTGYIRHMFMSEGGALTALQAKVRKSR